MGEAIEFAVKLIFGDLTLKSNLKRQTGKGKEFNKDGKLIYEGEFLNGEKHGKGKIYDMIQTIILKLNLNFLMAQNVEFQNYIKMEY